MKKIKICVECDLEYSPHANGQKCCSKTCLKTRRKKQNKEWLEEHKEERKQYKKSYRIKNAQKISEWRKCYYQKNKKQEKKICKKYYKENREKILAQKHKSLPELRIYKQNYDKLHRKEQKEYRKGRREQRRKTLKKYFIDNPEQKVLRNLRIRIWSLLKGKNKSKTTMKLLGCSIEYFKQHLEKQFKKGMSWDNYNRKGWHVDHIIPCIHFNLEDPIELQKCFHYTNLRPLWAEENLRRQRKINLLWK